MHAANGIDYVACGCFCSKPSTKAALPAKAADSNYVLNYSVRSIVFSCTGDLSPSSVKEAHK